MHAKRALVFSGGGGKGGYQIGAWKAVREIGFVPDMVIGTSVGALNGALVAMDKFDEALDIWENMSMERVFTKFAENTAQKDIDIEEKVSLLALEVIKNKGAEIGPLQDLVYSMMDEKLMRSSSVRFGLVTTKFPNLKAVELFVEDMPQNTIADYILASAACFPFVKTKRIGEMSFIDGGYTENMPIRMAIEAGATEIVVVDISSNPDLMIVNDDATIHYIRSKALSGEGQFNMSKMLMFDKDLSKKYMAHAYLDTLKEFGALDGYLYAFEKGEKFKMRKYEEESGKLFKKIFCCLPCEGLVERMARESVTRYMNKCVENPFEQFSNTMLCEESAASIFKIDTTVIYTAEKLAKLILDSLNTVKNEKESMSESDPFARISEAKIISGIKQNFDIFEERRMLVEITRLLFHDDIDIKQKNIIWLVAIAFPELICSALFCAAAATEENYKFI